MRLFVWNICEIKIIIKKILPPAPLLFQDRDENLVIQFIWPYRNSIRTFLIDHFIIIIPFGTCIIEGLLHQEQILQKNSLWTNIIKKNFPFWNLCYGGTSVNDPWLIFRFKLKHTHARGGSLEGAMLNQHSVSTNKTGGRV